MASSSAPAPQPAAAEAIETISADGTRLAGELHRAASPRGVALIVHGYYEHGGRYREVAQTLAAAGLTALAIDLRGHGRSEGPRGVVRRFTEYLDDMEAGLHVLAERAGAELPVLLLCHSNGGLAGLRLLADPFRCPPNIRAAVLSSPLLQIKAKVSPLKRAVGRVASAFLPALSLPTPLEASLLTHDPDRVRERECDTLCHDVAGARWYTEVLATQAWVREFAHRVAVPTLWLVAGADEIVDPAASRAVHARLTAPSEYEELPGLYHEVLNEVERAALLARIGSWVDKHFSSNFGA